MLALAANANAIFFFFYWSKSFTSETILFLVQAILILKFHVLKLMSIFCQYIDRDRSATFYNKEKIAVNLC